MAKGYRKIKTRESERKAIDKYREKFDVVSVRLPAGTADRMKSVDFTPADRVAAIMAALEEREKQKPGGE